MFIYVHYAKSILLVCSCLQNPLCSNVCVFKLGRDNGNSFTVWSLAIFRNFAQIEALGEAWEELIKAFFAAIKVACFASRNTRLIYGASLCLFKLILELQPRVFLVNLEQKQYTESMHGKNVVYLVNYLYSLCHNGRRASAAHSLLDIDWSIALPLLIKIDIYFMRICVPYCGNVKRCAHQTFLKFLLKRCGFMIGCNINGLLWRANLTDELDLVSRSLKT